MSQTKSETECCPRFDPTPWDGKTFQWQGKRFIKGKVFTLFHVPVNFGPVIVKLMRIVEKAGAVAQDNLCLSDHTSPWNMDIYLSVDRSVPGAENVEISGNFLSKVYEGDYKETGAWCKDFERLAAEKGVKIGKWYMWYTTCPKCAQKYGKNYVAIMAKV